MAKIKTREFLKMLPKDAIDKIENVVFKDIKTSFEKNIGKMSVADLDTEINYKSKVIFDTKDDICKRTMYYIFKYSGFYSGSIDRREFTDAQLNADFKTKVDSIRKSLSFNKDRTDIKSDIKLGNRNKSIKIDTELTVNTNDSDIKKLTMAFLHGGEANVNDSTIFIEKMDSMEKDSMQTDISKELNKWIDDNYKELYEEIGKKFGKEWPNKVELK